MDYEDPYESLPPTSTPTTHMLAGSAAGVLEHSVMYPVDCVKVRVRIGCVPEGVRESSCIQNAGSLTHVHITFRFLKHCIMS